MPKKPIAVDVVWHRPDHDVVAYTVTYSSAKYATTSTNHRWMCDLSDIEITDRLRRTYGKSTRIRHAG